MRARVLLALGVLLAGVLVTPTGATAATVTVCVKKATGVVKLSSSGKCRKGWKKRTFSTRGVPGRSGVPGTKGGPGPAGLRDSGLVVIDGDGKPLGTLAGIMAFSPLILFVEIDGGVYPYLSNGNGFPTATPVFTDAACSGPPQYPVASAAQRDSLLSQTAFRFAYRPNSVSLPAFMAFRLTSTYTTAVAQPTFALNASGVCVAGPLVNGFLIQAQYEPNIRDVPGPVRLQG
jgi:hypothetical protein